MTNIEKIDFVGAFPDELRKTNVPEEFWNQFSSAFSVSWDVAFKDYTGKEAIQKLIQAVTIDEISKIIKRGKIIEIERGFNSQNWNHWVFDHQESLEHCQKHKPEQLPPVGALQKYADFLENLKSGSLSFEEKLTLIRTGLNAEGTQIRKPQRPISILNSTFRFRVQESISRKIPFNDWIQHDEKGGEPARSKIVTGNAVLSAINSTASSVTGIPKREKQR